MKTELRQRLAAECIGTAFLLATVVGSGIMGERLAGGNVGLALLANSVATGAILWALILTLEPLSAHFNPVVTLCEAASRRLPWAHVPPYLLAQLAGAFLGVGTANLMFGLPCFSASHHVRSGLSQCFSEGVATFGLVLIIFTCARLRPKAVPTAVAAYITAAYWFT
ncbi:MAG TPA: MIP/aquaporin family protein, partial [Candidatus Xenobia bacterium]